MGRPGWQPRRLRQRVGGEAVSETHFSLADDASVGTFHYPLGLVAFTISPESLAFVAAGCKRPLPEDEEEQFRIAAEATSLVHEMRHFFDVFGTWAGISLLSTQLHVLSEFVALCDAMRRAGMRWQMPITDWAAGPDCCPEIRLFVRRALAIEICTDLFVSPFTPFEIDGHRDELLIEVDYAAGGKADAFPSQVFRVKSLDDARARTVLHPFGFEALLEGNAHAICRQLVSQWFPEPVQQRMKGWMRTLSPADRDGIVDQRAAQTALPYMSTDLLVSRFMQGYGINSFPGEVLLHLSDRVLSTNRLQVFPELVEGASAVQFDRLGRAFVDLLEDSGPAAIASGCVPPRDDVDRVYDTLASELSAGGDLSTISDDYSPASSISIWQTYIAKTFIVPLLRRRLATSHRAFTSFDGFLELLPVIGLPPARVPNGKLVLERMPQRVQQAWWHCLILLDVLGQLVRGAAFVSCPRAFATVPGITTMNLAFQGKCETNLRLGCGTFPSEMVPACLFAEALKVCSLRRSS